MSDRFAHHYVKLTQYLSGINAVMQQAVETSMVFHRGVRAQWAVLNDMAMTEADMLGFLAASQTELEWVAGFADRRAELQLAYDAHKDALDLSK